MSVAISGRKLALGGLVAGLGGIVSIVSAFIPVETAKLGSDSMSMSLWDGNPGKTISVVSLIAIALAAMWLLGRLGPIPKNAALAIIIVAGAIVLLVAGANYGTFNDDVNLANSIVAGAASLGIGLYVTALGGLLLVAGAVLGFVQKEA
jgi:hypothetical protein